MVNGLIFIVRAATQILRILEDISIKEFYRDHLHRESHLIFTKKSFRQTLSTNFIQQIFSNNCPGAYLKFQLIGVVLITRRALDQGGRLLRNY